MTCYKDDKYIDYLEGQLKPREQASFEVHLRDCADCQKIIRQLELTLGYVRKVSVELPAEDYWSLHYQGIRRRLQEQKTSPSYKFWNWHWWWAPKPALAAAFSLLAVCLIIVKMVFFPAPPAPAPPTPQELAQIKSWGENLTVGDLEHLWNQRSAEDELQTLSPDHYEQLTVKLLQTAEVREGIPAPPAPAISSEDDDELMLEEEIDRLSPEEKIWLEKRLKDLA